MKRIIAILLLLGLFVNLAPTVGLSAMAASSLPKYVDNRNLSISHLSQTNESKVPVCRFQYVITN